MNQEMKVAVDDLIAMIENNLSGELTAIEIHDLFWENIWGKGDFGKDLPDEAENPLIDEIFYTFEDFVVHPELSPEDIEFGIGEEEFLQRCREFLPKLKELASKD